MVATLLKNPVTEGSVTLIQLLVVASADVQSAKPLSVPGMLALPLPARSTRPSSFQSPRQVVGVELDRVGPEDVDAALGGSDHPEGAIRQLAADAHPAGVAVAGAVRLVDDDQL
jgi:hypothetical protein